MVTFQLGHSWTGWEVQVQIPNQYEGKAIEVSGETSFPTRAQAKTDMLHCTFPLLVAGLPYINFLLRDSPLRGSLCHLSLTPIRAPYPKPLYHEDSMNQSTFKSVGLVSSLLLILNNFLVNSIMHIF